jgi:hypothetical protein
VFSLIFGLSAATPMGPTGLVNIVQAVDAVLWLLFGAGWLRAVARARRAARTGQWPVRPEPPVKTGGRSRIRLAPAG